MQPATPSKPKGAASAPASVTAKATELGLSERRRSVRPLPIPEAVESDGDTDWAAFQALLSDEPKKP